MPDSNAFGEFLTGERRPGVDLTAAQKAKFEKLIQSKKGGKGSLITGKELTAGGKATKSSSEDFENYFGTVARTYGVSQLAPGARRKLEQKGYTEEGGYYTKQMPLTGAMLEKGVSLGYKPEDIRSYLAQNLADSTKDEEVAKFMTQGNYQRDPSTGAWKKIEPISVAPGDDEKDDTTPSLEDLLGTDNKGPYAGLSPDQMGSTMAEIDYATRIDPYKIQAKTAERQSRISQGTSLYNLIPYAFS